MEDNNYNEEIGYARILDEYEVTTPEDNVVLGVMGAMLFSLIGGFMWFVCYKAGIFVSVVGFVAVICTNFGYKLFARGESLRGVVISVITSVISIVIAWYFCLSLDCYNAYQEWYVNNEIDYTITFYQAIRNAYKFLQYRDIALSYGGSLILGLVTCGVGALGPIRKAINRFR